MSCQVDCVLESAITRAEWILYKNDSDAFRRRFGQTVRAFKKVVLCASKREKSYYLSVI